MADKYLGFKYDGKSLGQEEGDDFNGFIKNDGDELRFFNPSNFGHEFTTPQFGSQSYFLGTTRENREFSLSVVLEEIELSEYRTFLRWLDPEKEGILSFNYNSDYGYLVKVNSIGEGNITPMSNSGVEKYHIEIEISFITKNDWAAKWIKTEPIAYVEGGSATSIPIDNDLENPFYVETNGSWALTNYHNVDNYYKIHYEVTTPNTGVPLNLLIEKNAGDYCLIAFAEADTIYKGTIYTEYGIIINDAGEFISNEFTNTTRLLTAPGEILALEFTHTGLTNVLITIEPISREII